MQLSNGTCTVITSTRWVDTLVTVYNISVADNHNYFAEGVLTHNNDCGYGDSYADFTVSHRKFNLRSTIPEHKAHFGYLIDEYTYTNNSAYSQMYHGYYIITYENGLVYIGKGTKDRSKASAKENSIENNYVKVVKVEWHQAYDQEDAYIKEAFLLDIHGGAKNLQKNYNEKKADKGILYYGSLDENFKRYYDNFFKSFKK